MNVQKYTRKREANTEWVLYSTASLCIVHFLKVWYLHMFGWPDKEICIVLTMLTMIFLLILFKSNHYIVIFCKVYVFLGTIISPLWGLAVLLEERGSITCRYSYWIVAKLELCMLNLSLLMYICRRGSYSHRFDSLLLIKFCNISIIIKWY